MGLQVNNGIYITIFTGERIDHLPTETVKIRLQTYTMTTFPNVSNTD